MKKTIIFTVLSLFLASCTPHSTAEETVSTEDQSIAVTENITETSEAAETESDTESESVTEPITEPITEPATESETETEVTEQTEPPASSERPTVYYSGDTVYLTFDDGPGKYTEQVLEILDEYGVKATFFVVGTRVERYPDRLRMIAEAGHSIGAHSMTHEYASIYADEAAIVEDLIRWENTVSDAIGYVPAERLYRFPGGSTCTLIGEGMFPMLHGALTDYGYRCFDWTFANNDKYTSIKPEDQTMVDFLKESSVATLKLCYNRKIMLLHETTAETVEMLPWLIEYLMGEGYTLEPLTYANAGYTFAK